MSTGSTFRKLVCQETSSDFEKAVAIVTVDKLTPKENEVLIKTRYVGVNATDLNITAARYFGAKPPPFDLGLEGVGEVLELGSGVKGFTPGQAVAYVSFNAYAEIVCLPAENLIPLPSLKPEYVSLLVSGLTAGIGLDKVGELKKGEKVLITAAAGGLGQFAVQWAKLAGCHVIGMCSTKQKADFIKSLGCDFVINYREDDLDKVLKEHYPDGLDVIWETIGGKTFEILTNHLAVKGRLVIIGGIEGYQSVGMLPVDLSATPAQLLFKSSSLRGFLLTHFVADFAPYFIRLAEMLDKGQLKVHLDQGENSAGGIFKGLDDVPRAVQHLHSGKSSGKVCVPITA